MKFDVVKSDDDNDDDDEEEEEEEEKEEEEEEEEVEIVKFSRAFVFSLGMDETADAKDTL